MTCGICGRRLRGIESIQRGYGPVCYRKIMPPAPKRARTAKNSGNYNLIDDEDYNIPGQMELSDFIEMPSEGGKDCD